MGPTGVRSPDGSPLCQGQREGGGRRASVAPHIWEGRLPADLPVGGHLITVRALDMFGQEFWGTRIVRVVEEVIPAEEPEGGSD